MDKGKSGEYTSKHFPGERENKKEKMAKELRKGEDEEKKEKNPLTSSFFRFNVHIFRTVDQQK